ncbi:hypothetical protein GQR36_14840 [Enterococcus termitis]
MDIHLEVQITEKKTTIKLNSTQSVITILPATKKHLKIETTELYLLLNGHKIVSIGRSEIPDTIDPAAFTKIMTITTPWDIELGYLEQLLIEEAKNSGLDLIPSKQTEQTVPTSAQKTITAFKEEIVMILETFGYHLKQTEEPTKTKAKPAKARHKWTKEVSQIEFTLNTRESRATVFWQKRNEMLIKAGATMMTAPPSIKMARLVSPLKWDKESEKIIWTK